jgi:hypothetical protein
MKNIITIGLFLATWNVYTFKEILFEKNNNVANRSGIEKADMVVQMSLNKLGITNVNVLILPFRKSWEKSNTNLKAFVIENTDSSYIIYMRKESNPIKIIKILTHECIHIKQYNTNVLHVDTGIVRWKEDIYTDRELIHYITYSSRPWERDAFSKGHILFKSLRKIILEK